ncbi:MAG TPA: hypothetical protein VF598_03460, partial [Hymenobacter sp.]
MKHFIRILMLTISIVGLVQRMQAQAPAQCGTPTISQMPQNYADWHWEVEPENAAYCQTWIINRTNNGVVKVDAPWISARDGYFYNMRVSKDYLPNKGWVLI